MSARDDMTSAEALVARGTMLRDALDAVVAAHAGALVTVGDEEAVARLGDGGFDIEHELTPQALYELCKMDGAVIVDAEVRRIIRANVHLVPDRTLATSETGIRHRIAEQLSRATEAVVIAVSERRGTITLYRSGERRVLR